MSSSARANQGEINDTLEPEGPEIGYEEVNSTLEPGNGKYEDNRTISEFLGDCTGYEGETSTRLNMAEIGAGQEEEAFYAFLGLNTFLKKNGYDEALEQINIGGGLQTEDPQRWGKRMEAYMRDFKQDPEDNEMPEPDRVDAVLKATDPENLDEVDEGWYDLHDRLNDVLEKYENELVGKLESGSAHRQYTKKRMTELLEDIDAEINYAMGEEERGFNRKEEAENFVSRLSKRIEQYHAQKEEDLEDAKEERSSTKEALENLDGAIPVLKNVYQRIQGFYNGNNGDVTVEELKDRRDKVIDEEIEGVDSVYEQELKSAFEVDDSGFEGLETAYNDLKEEYEEAKHAKDQLFGGIQQEIDDLEREIASIKAEEESKFLNPTNRLTLSNTDAELLNFAAMEYIREDVENKIPESHRDNLNILSDEKATVESDEDSLFDDLLLAHNYMWGDTPSKYQTMRAAKAMEEEYRVNRDTDEVPDTVGVSDTSGPFTYFRFDVTGNYPVSDDKDEESYEVSVTTLPIFQSQDKIRENSKKGVHNQNTKRDYKTEDGDTVPTGVMLQTRLEDGSEVPIHLEEKSLTNLGRMTKKILKGDLGEEDYLELENSIDFMDEELEKRGYDSFESLLDEEYNGLEDYVEEFCAIPKGVILGNADWHDGAPEIDVAEPSKREKIRSTIDYQTSIWGDSKANGTPIGNLLSETIDGDEAWYGKENLNPGQGLNEMRELASETFDGTELGDLASEIESYALIDDLEEQEMEELLQLQQSFMGEFLEFHETYTGMLEEDKERSPLPGSENQFNDIRPYMPPLLNLASTHFLVSGNHISDRMGTDEAERLEDLLNSVAYEEGMPKEEVNIRKYGSNGDSGGGFGSEIIDEETFPELNGTTNKRFGFHHETKGAKHRLLKVAREHLKANRMYDETFYNHIHKQGSMVLGDGSAITVTPSVKNTDQRGERSGYGGPTWGVVGKLFNTAEEGHAANNFNWHGWHYAGPDTLSSEEFGSDKLDDKMDDVKQSLEGIGATSS